MPSPGSGTRDPFPAPIPASCKALAVSPTANPCKCSAHLRLLPLPLTLQLHCFAVTLPHPWPPLPLALPFVFFSFLQTRQATRVLNPTRVPKASPAATTMPSSGTSIRVARSPADCPLVSFHMSGTPTLTCHKSEYSVLAQSGWG